MWLFSHVLITITLIWLVIIIFKYFKIRNSEINNEVLIFNSYHKIIIYSSLIIGFVAIFLTLSSDKFVYYLDVFVYRDDLLMVIITVLHYAIFPVSYFFYCTFLFFRITLPLKGENKKSLTNLKQNIIFVVILIIDMIILSLSLGHILIIISVFGISYYDVITDKIFHC